MTRYDEKIDVKTDPRVLVSSFLPLPTYATSGSAGLDLRAVRRRRRTAPAQRRWCSLPDFYHHIADPSLASRCRVLARGHKHGIVLHPVG